MPESMNPLPAAQEGLAQPNGNRRYSSFSLNYVSTPAGKDNFPNWRGQATVLDPEDGKELRFEVAGWGPKKAESGIEYFDLRFSPADPIERARQDRNRTDIGPVRNKPRNFELLEIGLGKLFEQEPSSDRPADPRKPPARLTGFTLLRFPTEDLYVRLSLWERGGGVSKGKRYAPFLSGNADIHDEDAAEAARAARMARSEPHPQ
jgi:hypothetical protein